MLVHILQRIGCNSFQRISYSLFLSLTIHWICRFLNLSGFLLASVSLVTASCSWYRWTLILNSSSLEWYSTCRDSKWVRFDTTSYKSTYCNAWWLHKMLIFNMWNCLFFALYSILFICTDTGRLWNTFHAILMISSWCYIFLLIKVFNYLTYQV